MDERAYWLGFSVFPQVGPKRFAELLLAFTTAKAAWNASRDDLRGVLGTVLTAKFEKFRDSFSLKFYTKELRKKNVSFLILSDVSYPVLLKKIPNPPFVLYIKGTLDFDQSRTIGVVGTRRITGYGKTVTQMITGDLVMAGYAIVSGLAMGVDSVAHATAVEHKGITVAVLGCGVDCCTPSTNQSLYNSIIDGGGAVISEFPLGMLPTKGSFPSRNRIIAGLSHAVIVTEGAEDSGSLITASKALEFGRPVFAVPGPITSSLSKGPNKLLSEGAKLVTSAEDILRELGIKQSAKSKGQRGATGETKEEQVIIDLLQNEPMHFDEIVKRTDVDPSEIGVLLSEMELKGLICSTREGYALIRM